jgi:hypothetical protein
MGLALKYEELEKMEHWRQDKQKKAEKLNYRMEQLQAKTVREEREPLDSRVCKAQGFE